MREFIDQTTTLQERETGVTLGDLVDIKVQNENADFWIVRRGSEDKVGEPTKTYNPEHFGITVTATDRLDPNYLFYAMMHLHMQGVWKGVATGTTRLVNIKLSDLKNIPLG